MVCGLLVFVCFFAVCVSYLFCCLLFDACWVWCFRLYLAGVVCFSSLLVVFMVVLMFVCLLCLMCFCRGLFCDLICLLFVCLFCGCDFVVLAVGCLW